MKLCLLSCVLVVVACGSTWSPPPISPPTDRDGPGNPMGQACIRLREVGCPEGWPSRSGRTCFETLTSAAELASVPSACLAGARSVDDVRACGSANTVRVRCIMPTAERPGSTVTP